MENQVEMAAKIQNESGYGGLKKREECKRKGVKRVPGNPETQCTRDCIANNGRLIYERICQGQ